MIAMFHSTSHRAPLHGLGERLPQALLCCIFSFLDGGAHAAMSRASWHFRHAARLPQASCWDVTLDWHLTHARVALSVLASRPRVVRLTTGAPNPFMASMDSWLSLAPQLHTLQLCPGYYQSLCGLSRLGSLRHLLLSSPSAYSLVTALHGCGARLRTLRLHAVDAIDVTNPCAFDIPAATSVAPLAESAAPAAAATTATESVVTQLAQCTALESLGLHASGEFRSDVVSFLRAAHLPALRSLSVIQDWCATNSMEGLPARTTLTALCYHVSGLKRILDWHWVPMPCLRTLDLGSTRDDFDYSAIKLAMPELARLRVACNHPMQLGGFTQLTDLTILDAGTTFGDGGDSPPFGDQLAVLLPLLTDLQCLGVMHFCDNGSMPALKLAMPRVSRLALGLRSAYYPRIEAPALRSMRVSNMRGDTLLRIAAACPLLERVELCGSPTGRKEAARAARERTRCAIVDCEAEFDLRGRFCHKTFAADGWP